MSNIHEPDPQFLEKLEWHLESEGRRICNLHTHSEQAWNWKNLKMLGIIVLSVFFGFIASSTAAHIKDTSQRPLLLAKQEIRIQQHESHHKLLQVRHRDVLKKVDLGLLPPEHVRAVDYDLFQSEVALNRLKLDYEEIQISSRPPLNDLSAPLFGERDFVTERLQLQRMEMQEAVRILESNLEETQRKVDLGLINPNETGNQKMELKTTHLAIEFLDRKIQLRNRFNEGAVSAKQADLLGMVSEAEEKQEELKAWISHYQSRLAALEEALEAGLASTFDVLEAQSQLEAAKAEQQIVQLELQILRNNLE